MWEHAGLPAHLQAKVSFLSGSHFDGLGFFLVNGGHFGQPCIRVQQLAVHVQLQGKAAALQAAEPQEKRVAVSVGQVGILQVDRVEFPIGP